MAITHQHFKAGGRASWKFPITVAAFGTKIAPTTLYQKYFAVANVPLHRVNQFQNLLCDILVITGDMLETRLSVWRPDIVFVVLNEADTKATVNNLLQKAKLVAAQTGAIGVFLFSLPVVTKDISSWFDMFASHYAMPGILRRTDWKSESLPQMLQNMTGDNGLFYYDMSRIDRLNFAAVDDGRSGGGIQNIPPRRGDSWLFKKDDKSNTPWKNIINESTNDDKETPPDRTEQDRPPLILFDKKENFSLEDADWKGNFSHNFSWKNEDQGENDHTGNSDDADDSEAILEMVEMGDPFDHIDNSEDIAIEIVPEPEEPRYMQVIIDEAEGVITNIKDRLFFNTDYNIQLFIGTYDPAALAATDAFRANVVFENKDTQREPIRILFKTSSDKDARPQETVLFLPRKGNTNKAVFGFTTATNPDFSAEVFAYHHNRLIQKITIRAVVQDRKKMAPCPPIQIATDFCARKQLDGLDDRHVAGFSLAYETTDDGTIVTTGISDGRLFSYPASSGLSNLLDNIKNTVQGAALDLDTHPEDLFDANNAELLRTLAYKGGDLFQFLGAPDPGDAIQIVSNRPEFVPFDFVYTAGTPTQDAPVCPHAREALNEGKCQGCNGSVSPAPYICPLGFWGFSKIMERYKYDTAATRGDKDYTIIAEPVHTRKTLSILQNTLYASTSRLETTATAGLRDRVAEAVKNNVRAPGIADRADDWNIWKTCVTERSHDMLILAVHIEKNEQGIDMLEIGNNDLLMRNLLTDHIRQNLRTSPPLVCIIGCESANIEAQGFDVSSQLMYTGVAAVVCNFTKIRGRQAATIITKLMELLGQHRDKEFRLGEIMLKLKQYLLAEGIMVGISVYALGDADWIIKT